MAFQGVLLHETTNQPTLGMEDRESRPDLLGETEQIQFEPELAVIAPFGLFQPMQVRIQVFLRCPCRAVDAG